eukprot:8245646-Pyramimonas_sp.AAC.1
MWYKLWGALLCRTICGAQYMRVLFCRAVVQSCDIRGAGGASYVCITPQAVRASWQESPFLGGHVANAGGN